jgi:flagellar basal body rod protein FlgC
MIRALYSAASGMLAQQLNVDNIANNLANANTTGFKNRKVQFQDLLYQTLTAPGTQAGEQTVFPTGLQLGLGARVVANEVIFRQGDFVGTGNPLSQEDGVRLLRDDYRLPDSVVAPGQLRNIPVTGFLVAVSGARFRPPGRTRLYISSWQI